MSIKMLETWYTVATLARTIMPNEIRTTSLQRTVDLTQYVLYSEVKGHIRTLETVLYIEVVLNSEVIYSETSL